MENISSSATIIVFRLRQLTRFSLSRCTHYPRLLAVITGAGSH